MDKLRDMALAGDLDAIKVILDRVDGKVLERHEVTSAESLSIHLRWDDGEGDA
jgi:hypothetical protein